MKKIILLAVLFFLSTFTFCQTTYYWVGGNGPISFSSTNGSWNTSLDGSGTMRTVNSQQDIFIFDGNNIGGSNPRTGTVTITDSTNSMAQIKLLHNANVIYQRNISGTSTISIIGDGTNDDDFYIDSTSTFTLTSLDTTGGNVLEFAATATGRIFGKLDIVGGACRLSNLNFTAGGSIFFESGSISNVFVTRTTSATNYPFGKDVTAKNGIVFKRGSLLNYLGGYSIFTNTSGFSPILFNEGSTLKINYNIPSFYVTSSNFFSSRKLADVIIAENKNVTAGSFYSLNNLTVEQGARLNLTSSYTPISGNLINNGTINTDDPATPGVTMYRLLFLGSTPQTISGSGVFDSLGAIIVGSNANLILNRDLKIMDAGTTSKITGILNTNNYCINGSGKLYVLNPTSGVNINVTAGGNSGSDTLRLNPSLWSSANIGSGNLVIGDSIAPDTYIIATSSTNSRITLSKPTLGIVSTISVISKSGTIATSNNYGLDSSIKVTTKSYESGTNYIFNGPTIKPFSSGTTTTTGLMTTIGNLTINAAVKTNKSMIVSGILGLQSGKFTISANDSIRVTSKIPISGAPFDSLKYIALEKNGLNIGKLRVDSISSRNTLPIGTTDYYLPVTISTTQPTTISANVYEGITLNGTVSGTPLSDNRKVVNAVWQLNKISGTSNANVTLGWNPRIEGLFFKVLPNAEIGIIQNNNGNWGLPLFDGDNTSDTASSSVNTLGVFSVGSKPQTNGITYNVIPSKTYGDIDFSLGVVSLNTTQPIQYASSNVSVATVSSNGIIHIVGAGDANISVTQISDGLYPDTTITRNFQVNKKLLTITAVDNEKFERDPNPSFEILYNGFVLNEDTSVLTTKANAATTCLINSPAGQYPIVLNGATSSNYSFNYIPGILTVKPKIPSVINFPNILEKTYGDPIFSSNVSSNNDLQSIALYSTDTNVVKITAGNNIYIIGAGRADVIATQAGNNYYFPADTVKKTVIVKKAPLTIKAIDTVRNQGDANPVFIHQMNGFVLGEDASIFLTPLLDSTPANLSSDTGSYSIYPYSATAKNYQIIFNTGVLKIEKNKPFTFRLETSKKYGDSDFVVKISSINISQPINCESSDTNIAKIYYQNIDSTWKIHIKKTGSVNIRAFQPSDGINSMVDTSKVLTIEKALITVKVNNQSKYQGLSNPAFSASYIGFKNGENESVFTTPVTFKTTATDTTMAGLYDIIGDSASAINYTFNYFKGTLTIIPRTNQAITFDTIYQKTYGDGNFTCSVNSSSNLPILLSSSDTNIAKVLTGNTIKITGAGTVIITASQSGDTTYLPAINKSRQFLVNKALLTIKANDTIKYEGLPNPNFTATYTGLVNGDLSSSLNSPPMYNTIADELSDTGLYTITPFGAISNKYLITYLSGNLKINPNQFTFPLILPRNYGDPNFNLNVTTQNISQPVLYTSSDTTVAIVSNIGEVHIVGAGTANINARQISDGNFPNGNKTRTLIVNKAHLTITADNNNKFEGYPNPAFLLTYNGFVLGENQSVLTFLPTPTTNATLNSPVGTYPIFLDSASANNYSIILINGTLTINPNQVQRITFNSISAKTYGTADFNPGATSTNNTIPIVYTSSNPNVATIISGNIHITGTGTTDIIASQPAGVGYLAAAEVTKSLVVNKANLIISLVDTFKTEGTENPIFRISGNGFVLGETFNNLSKQPLIKTVANLNSLPGIYPVIVDSAESNNYNISYVNGKMSVYPNNQNKQSISTYVNTSKNLVVKIYSTEFNLGELKLYTMSGQFVTKKSMYVPEGFSTYEVPLNNIVSGYYILVFYEKDKILSKVISIMR